MPLVRGYWLVLPLLIGPVSAEAGESRSASYTNVTLEAGTSSPPVSSNLSLPAAAPVPARAAADALPPAPPAAVPPQAAPVPAPAAPPPWLRLIAGASLGIGAAALVARRLSRKRSNEVLAAAAHELKSPLAALESYLALMEHEGKSGAAADTRAWLEDVARMRTTAAHLRRTIGSILEMTRLDDARIKLEPRGMDLADCARETAASFGALAAEAGIALETRAEPAPSWGDPARVRQILDNLVANALRHAPDGGRVEISTGRDAAGRPWCLIVDDGKGVPKARRSGLFTRFARLSPPLRGEPGTGLGLYIGRALARAQGGELSHETNARGRGAAFRLTLPPGRTS
jgi:signal transduction histidine kinase